LTNWWYDVIIFETLETPEIFGDIFVSIR